MLPRTLSNPNRHTSRNAMSRHTWITRPAVLDIGSGSALLLKGGQDLNRFGISSTNSVYPVAPIVRSLVPKSSTTGREKKTPASALRVITASSPRYLVKVQILHGIDLYMPSTKATCQHAVRPEVNIAANGGAMQSCTAAQHARNHSIWKKHELIFRVSNNHEDTGIDGEATGFTSFVSMYVSLSCSACLCTAKAQDKVQTPIGEVGELQFPTQQNESYEISRFFPVIRRQTQQSSQSSYTFLPAGKIKLCIRVEVEKSVLVAQPEIPSRPPFALPITFGEALQLKRKQLKATVVPEAKKMNSQQASQIDSEVSIQLLKEMTVEAAQDLIDASDLKDEVRVGEGIHACVSVGTLRRGNDGKPRQVAAKEFRHRHAVPPVNVLRAFQQEYRILERCRTQNGHQHIVKLIGVILEPRLIILMEYFSHGSLAQCLQDEVAWGRMTLKQKATLGLKIAQGLAWMHKHDMVHRDVKTHNILIGDSLATPNPTVKVGDLGSTALLKQQGPPLLGEVGSSGYTAPEIFTHHGYDSKVDVWSFGIVLWELMSSSSQNRVNPFAGMAGEEFVSKAQSGCRPNFIHAHQLCTKPTVEKCWNFNPSERPSMDEVVRELEKLCSEL